MVGGTPALRVGGGSAHPAGLATGGALRPRLAGSGCQSHAQPANCCSARARSDCSTMRPDQVTAGWPVWAVLAGLSQTVASVRASGWVLFDMAPSSMLPRGWRPSMQHTTKHSATRRAGPPAPMLHPLRPPLRPPQLRALPAPLASDCNEPELSLRDLGAPVHTSPAAPSPLGKAFGRRVQLRPCPRQGKLANFSK